MALKFPAEITVFVEVLRSPFLALQLISEVEEIDLGFVFFNHPEKYDIALEEGIKFAKRLLKKGGIFQIFDFFSKRLLVFDQGIPKVRKDRLELFHFLSTSIDFNQLLTFELSKELLDFNSDHVETIFNRFNSSDILVDSRLPKVLKEVSDLHIHLGGALRFPWRFRDIMESPLKVNLRYLPKDPIIDSLPRYFPLEFVSDVREILHFLIILTAVLERILAEFLETGREILINEELKDILEALPSLGERANCGTAKNGLLAKALDSLRKRKVLEGDRFFLLALFSGLNYCNNSTVLNYFQAYLILRNYIKSIMVQQHRKASFLYFSWFSRSSLRRRKELEEYSHIADSLRSSFPPSVKLNVEARLSFQETPAGYYKIVREVFRRFNRKRNFNVKLVFHFIKKEDRPPSNGFENWIRRQTQRKKLLKQTKTFLKFLDTYGSRRLNKHFSVIDIISGIDAASKEHYAPPEIFSQVYLMLKRTIPFFCKNLRFNPSLKFTYHVGEEFKAVLLGILRVYEAVYFLNLTEGDRIGHGVALGISVEKFLQRRRNSCFLKKQEFLDGLSFLYYIFTRIKPVSKPKELLILKDKVELLLREALSRTSHIFRNLYPRINDYIDSWLLRRNSPIEFFQLIQAFMEDFNITDPEEAIELFTELLCSRKEQTLSSLSFKLDINDWDLYTALPDLFMEYLKLPEQDITQIERLIGNPAAWKFYYLYNFSQEWFEFMEEFHQEILPEREFLNLISEAQSVIRDYIKKRGIAVEVLLSSNLLITPIEKVEEHPIFTFLDDDIRVVLGSDNPGIQETNIRFELELLYSTLREKFGEKRACKILKDIVEEGNFIFRA